MLQIVLLKIVEVQGSLILSDNKAINFGSNLKELYQKFYKLKSILEDTSQLSVD